MLVLVIASTISKDGIRKIGAFGEEEEWVLSDDLYTGKGRV